jgi:molybdate transport system permease protein
MTWSLQPDELSALLLSLRVALWAVLGVAVPAVATAWLLARKRFPGRVLVDVLVHLPLVLPPVTVGYLLLVGLGRRSAAGTFLAETFGIELAFSTGAAVVASAVMGFPLMVRAVRLSFEHVDHGLEEVAHTLGAGPVKVFATVTLPLALPGVLTGATLAFARSLGEFGATIAFAGNIPGETRTVPLAVFSQMLSPGGEESAARLVLLSVALSMGALLASEMLARRTRRRMGLGG